MKEKGFTLVELLATIVIIGIVSLIVFPSVTSFINESKLKSYNIQKDLIEKAAKKWVTDNNEMLLKNDPYHLNNINLTLTVLKKEGYLSDKYIINPKNNKVMTGCVVATYNSNENQYEYTYNDGGDNYTKRDSAEEKLTEEISGCDSNKGYIYTYTTIDSDTLEETNGKWNSNYTPIEVRQTFADYLITSNATNLVNLGDEYYYQGLNVNNYVKIKGYDTVWNVLSIDKTNKTVKLVTSAKTVATTLLSSNPFNASSYKLSSDVKTDLEEEINKVDSNMIKKETDFNVGTISNVSNSSDVLASEEAQVKFTGKIGIITPSEFLKTKNSNDNSYLTSSSSTAWTMNFKGDKHIIINTSGNLEEADIDTSSRVVYATIVINANTFIESGSGTSLDPFVINNE